MHEYGFSLGFRVQGVGLKLVDLMADTCMYINSAHLGKLAPGGPEALNLSWADIGHAHARHLAGVAGLGMCVLFKNTENARARVQVKVQTRVRV
jgi:hypothetical protein